MRPLGAYSERPPVRNIATGLNQAELTLLREVVQKEAPDLAYLLSDRDHELTLDESDRLVEAIANEFTVDEAGGLDERSRRLDDLIGRVNLGPYLR